ncbi:MAG: cation diffusion facilitator family transporter [Exilispira sp.]
MQKFFEKPGVKEFFKNSKKVGYLEGILSIIINTSLFFLKIYAGSKSKSISMIADAWHTLSDTLTSIVVIAGFYISSLPRDEEHPFGHGRAELIASIIIGTLLAVVGFNFIVESINNLRNKVMANFKLLSLIVFAVSSVIKEMLASFSIWAGKKIDSRSLIADGWHHRSDALAAIIIVVAAISGKWLWWIDGVLGIIVSILILYTAYDVIKGSSNSLLGENVDEITRNKIFEIINNISSEISDIHHIHIHRYGDHLEISLHIRMNGIKDVNFAHNISNSIEKALKEELNAEATIHIEPEKH